MKYSSAGAGGTFSRSLTSLHQSQVGRVNKRLSAGGKIKQVLNLGLYKPGRFSKRMKTDSLAAKHQFRLGVRGDLNKWGRFMLPSLCESQYFSVDCYRFPHTPAASTLLCDLQHFLPCLLFTKVSCLLYLPSHHPSSIGLWVGDWRWPNLSNHPLLKFSTSLYHLTAVLTSRCLLQAESHSGALEIHEN